MVTDTNLKIVENRSNGKSEWHWSMAFDSGQWHIHVFKIKKDQPTKGRRIYCCQNIR